MCTEIGKIGDVICLSVLFWAQCVESIHMELAVRQTCEEQESRMWIRSCEYLALLKR